MLLGLCQMPIASPARPPPAPVASLLRFCTYDLGHWVHFTQTPRDLEMLRISVPLGQTEATAWLVEAYGSSVSTSGEQGARARR